MRCWGSWNLKNVAWEPDTLLQVLENPAYHTSDPMAKFPERIADLAAPG